MKNERTHKTLDWLGPLAVAIAFVLVLGAVVWDAKRHSRDTRDANVRGYARQAADRIAAELEGDRHYLLLLVRDMASGRLDKPTFQSRVSQFVADHPGLVNVTWADAGFIIRWAAPLEPNRQVIGLELALPEAKRASRAAKAQGAPVYTGVFAVVQGHPGFEVYVPVFRGGDFLGTFGGVYAIENVLRHALPEAASEHIHLAVGDGNGRMVFSLPRRGDLNLNESIRIPLDPPGHGMTLMVSAYRPTQPWRVTALVTLAAVLALGLAWTLARMQRQNRLRMAAEAATSRSESRLRGLYDAVYAGVIVQAADGEIVHANKVACETLHMPENTLTGMTSMNPEWQMVDEDGTPLTGEDHPSMITIRTGRPVRNVVRGLFAEDPSRMCWLLINTEPIFESKTGALREVMITFHDITDRKIMEEKLRNLATHDHLTGLHNRTILEDRIAADIARSRRYDHPLSVFMIDIDFFKRINDEYGHRAGDTVLRGLANILEQTIRRADYVARFGGEEFVVVLPETPLDKARDLATRLNRTVAETPLRLPNGKTLKLTVSVGIATFPEHGETAERLLDAADGAMYLAKNCGRNNVQEAP